MRTTWTFHTAGQLLFGRHAVRQLGEIAEQRGVKRALLVTAAVLLKAGVVQPVHASPSQSGAAAERLGGGEPGRALRAAKACSAAGREFRPDAIVGLGGGSNMDLAKITATVLAHGGEARDYVGDGKVPGPVTPLFCLPTTAGT